MDELTREVLQRLYVDELLTESEIAKRFGLYQVKVNRLRKKWGIPTVGKTGRLERSLPQPTAEQEQIILGSLLGDGHMRATSGTSAGFCEGHKEAHSGYTDWKGEKLRPFTSSFYWGSKRQGGSVFRNWNFITHSCPQLRRFYDEFYPRPLRVRVFPKNLPRRMTPLVLAIWYMDDGGVTQRGEPKIAFGLDDRSLRRVLSALRVLGLNPVVYGKGTDRGIHFPKQAMVFRGLVEPHLVPCMCYKIPTETEGQGLHRNARELTPERAADLYGGGLGTAQISDLFGVGSSTVSRRLKSAGVRKRSSGPRKVSYTAEGAAALLQSYDSSKWPNLPEDVREGWVASVLGILRNCPFPVPAPWGKERALPELDRTRRAEMRLEQGRVRPVRFVGVGLCGSFFPHRYKASAGGRRSAFEAWHRKEDLERAVRFQLKVGDPVVPHRVLRAVAMNCRTPTVFRPTAARFLYERFCPAGGTTWDACMGYGGRLLGAAAAGVRYIGTDVDPEGIEGHRRLADVLGASAEIVLCPAEEYSPPPIDMMFTSPPYFDQEHYAGGERQSWARYPDLDGWLEGFLRPVVRTARKALRPSGCFVLNIADVRGIPLVDAAKRIALDEGFRLDEELGYPLQGLNRTDPVEPLLIFR